MRKIFTILSFLVLMVSVGRAQTAASYGFSTATATFSSISSSGTTVSTIAADDATFTSVPIGFSFTYCGTAYTTLSACSNGWLSFSNTTSSLFTNSLTNVATISPGAIMPFWDDLYGVGAGGAYYTTTGTAPNRVFTFEWRNWYVCCSSTSGTGNMQVKLYESTNVIEFVYGTSSWTGRTGTIGIANSGTDYLTLPNSSASPIASSTTFTTSIATMPASGQVYRWTPPSPCSGTPASGTAVSSTASACPSALFTLSLTGMPAATGLTYQWQSSPDGTTWTNITGGTTASFATSETTATYYRCVVTCTASGISSNSTTVYVPCLAVCYCVPNYAFASSSCTTWGDNITQFSVTGVVPTAINDLSTCDGTGYKDMTALSVTLMQGTAYTTTIANGSTDVMNCQVWIDFNNDGTFSSTESVGGLNGYSGTSTFTMTIPAAAAIGTHRMRVVATWNFDGFSYPSISPCPTSAAGYNYGEARDYTVTIQGPSCSGTPTAGSVTASSTSVCVGSTVSLTLSGASSGAGITYQWQSSPDGTSWTNIPSATTTTYSSTISSNIYYRVVVTCTTSTLTANTSSILITALATPSPISGPSAVCVGNTITLAATPTTGTWSSSAATIATVGATGIAGGASVGTATISYTLSSGCRATQVVSVNPIPGPISGPSTLCVGVSATYSNTATGGLWVCAIPTVATITPSTGDLTPVSPGLATISYTFPGGCGVGAVLTVNPAPSPITGTLSACLGATATVSTLSTGGTWSSASSTTAFVNPTTGVVSTGAVGTTAISYTFTSTGCYTTAPFTVNPLPTTITGPTYACNNIATIPYSSTPSGGTWTSTNPSVAAIDAVSGSITPLTLGVTTISYTLPTTGCATGRLVTVSAAPAAITGPTQVCAGGATITLSSATTGGSWSSSSGVNASAGASTGVVTGLVAGGSTISYTLPVTGCYALLPIVISPLPSAIGGSPTVCQYSNITLTNATAGGAWFSSASGVATINITSGVAGGASVGSSIITYMMPAGCYVTRSLTVNPLPAPITGSMMACVGYTTSVSDATPGGFWSATPATVATISGTGTVYGTGTGTAIVSYTSTSTGCSITAPVVVNAVVPPSISLSASPGLSVCYGTPVTFTTSVTNGGTSPLYVWRVNDTTIDAGSTYTYTPRNGDNVRVWILSNGICAIPDTASTAVNINVIEYGAPLVSFSTGMGDTVCVGSPITFASTTTYGGAAPTYQWYVNYAPVSTMANYTYTPANGDIVKLTMHSNYPCRIGADSSTQTHIITVSSPVTPAVTIESSAPGVICMGSPVMLTATPINGGFYPTYTWDVNGMYTGGTGASYGYIPVNGDVVQVNMTSSFPCVTTSGASTTMTIAVTETAGTVGYVYAVPGAVVSPGTPVTFTAVVTSGLATGYQWFKNGMAITGATTNTYTTSSLMTGDSVTCAIMNPASCGGLVLFNAIGMTVDWPASINTVATNTNALQLIPNPNTGAFYIKGNIGTNTDVKMNVEVTNLLGQSVFSQDLIAEKGVINVPISLSDRLTNGIYMLKVNAFDYSNTLQFVISR